uniref:Aspartyl/asparaginy/proline hydroxylase domain-containing protein n=1 Tax=Pyrodinium bahamense TaxID=73915 RepID=A0A7S0FWT4_9DINO
MRSAPLPGKGLERSWSWCRRARAAVEAAIGSVAEEFGRARQEHLPQADNKGSGLSYFVQVCEPGDSCNYRFTVMDPPGRGRGRWAEYTVWDPHRFEHGFCAIWAFPRACELVAALLAFGVPLTRLSVTEVYPPETHIPRHHSPQQGRLRLLCPLEVAEGSSSRLVFPGEAELAYGAADRGRCWWFDESFEHELFYEGEAPRASLILDAPHPALVGSSPPLEPELGPPDVDERWPLLWTALAELAEELGGPPAQQAQSLLL